MKKLMIAMSAAAMMSLCAQAAPQGGVSLATGTNFENYDGDFSVTKDDWGGAAGVNKILWAQRAEGVTGDSALVTTNSNTYLKVDETEELTRLIDVNGGVASNATVSADSSVYFSSKVQFTAADDAPAVSNGVDKIIVWAKAPEDGAPEGTTTNLMVTAWDAEGSVTNIDTELTIDAESWYDLEIVASPSAGDNPISPISFMVKLGTNPAVGPFFSMVDEGTAATTISSASFKGTGAVDDIDWGTVAAVAAETFTVTVTATGTDDYGMGDAMATSLSFDVGTESVDIDVAATADQTITCNIEGYSVTSTPVEGYRTVTIPTASVAANATVAVTITVSGGSSGGDDPEIVVPDEGTAQGVVDAATSATGIPLKNVTADSQVVIDNVAHTITVGSAAAVTIPAYYTATLAANLESITLTLNDAALDTVGEMTAVAVDTTFGLSVSASNTKLYYGLSSCATVNGTYTAPTALTQGTGSALTIPAAKSGNQCFYKLYVTDIAPAQN